VDLSAEQIPQIEQLQRGGQWQHHLQQEYRTDHALDSASHCGLESEIQDGYPRAGGPERSESREFSQQCLCFAQTLRRANVWRQATFVFDGSSDLDENVLSHFLGNL